MANREETQESAIKTIKAKYMGLHNLLTLNYLQQKVSCFEKEGGDPVKYYQCYDRIEQKILRDGKNLREGVDLVEDEFTICRWECQKLE